MVLGTNSKEVSCPRNDPVSITRRVSQQETDMSIHRFLGLLAAMSHRMSRLRINFVPLNVGVFILLAVFAHKGVRMMAEACCSRSSTIQPPSDCIALS